MTLPMADAASVRTDHSEAVLLADHAVVRPGQSIMLALRLRHDAGWHSYWINPGDSGLATKMLWSLPEGWRAAEIRWPTPSRFEVDGLANYGYAGEVWLPVPVEVPADAEPGSTATLAGEARWLACADICVAEKAALEVTLRVGAHGEASEAADAIARRIAALPRTLRVEHGAIGTFAGGFDFRFEGLSDLPAGARYSVFPRNTQWLNHAPLEVAVTADHGLRFAAARSDFFTGWPQAPTLLLRPALDQHPGFELMLALDPPTEQGDTP